MTYENALAFLNKGRSKTFRRLSGRSSDMRKLDNGDIAIRYHNTDVVTLHADNSATLNSDGYQTATTKARINEYAPGRGISQRNGVWYMSDGSLYYDGMTIDADGNPITPKSPKTAEKLKRDLDKLVREYVAAFKAKIEEDRALPEPNSGDCWLCYMTVQSPEKHAGKSLGEANVMQSDADHILSHLREKYIFGSILWRAIQRRGNPQFCWQMANSYASRGDKSGLMLLGDLRYYLRQRKAAMLDIMQAEYEREIEECAA